jgi:hypothetical protein
MQRGRSNEGSFWGIFAPDDAYFVSEGLLPTNHRESRYPRFSSVRDKAYASCIRPQLGGMPEKHAAVTV